MTTKITAPAKVNSTSEFGPVRLSFVDGVATVEEPLSEGLRRYLEANRFQVEEQATEEPEEPAKAPAKAPAKQTRAASTEAPQTKED